MKFLVGVDEAGHLRGRCTILWYNTQMKNWSTDISRLQKNKTAFAVWRLEQLVNFGLGGEKINLAELRTYWEKLDIDPFKRKFLSLFV
jgi:hypothetical protein